MDVPFNSKMEAYYQKFFELQEKLRKSEEERLKLEMKFNELVQISREEEQAHYKKLRSQYKKFLEEDRKRQERNEKIIRLLERIESRVNMLSSKTERIKLLRRQYQSYLQRVSRGPIERREYISSKIDEELPRNDHVTSVTDYDQHSYDISILKKAYGKPNDEKIEILDKYLQSLKSQKVQIGSENKQVQNNTESNELKYFDDVTKKLDTGFNSNEANSIAEDIMNSIYARHYKKDLSKDESKKASKFTVSNNYISRQSEVTEKDQNSGYGDSYNDNFGPVINNSSSFGVPSNDLKKCLDANNALTNSDMSNFEERPHTLAMDIAEDIQTFEEDRGRPADFEKTPEEHSDKPNAFTSNAISHFNKWPHTLTKALRIFKGRARQTDRYKTPENIIKDNVDLSLNQPGELPENQIFSRGQPEKIYTNDEGKFSELYKNDASYSPSKAEIDLNENEKQKINLGNFSTKVNESEVQNVGSYMDNTFDSTKYETGVEDEINYSSEHAESNKVKSEQLVNKNEDVLEKTFSEASESEGRSLSNNKMPSLEAAVYSDNILPKQDIGSISAGYDLMENVQSLHQQDNNFDTQKLDIKQEDSREDQNDNPQLVYQKEYEPPQGDEYGNQETGQPLQPQFENDNQVYDENVQPYEQVDQYDANEQPVEQLYGENGKAPQQYDENGQPVYSYDQQYNEPDQQMYNQNDDENQQGKADAQYGENGQATQQFDEHGQPILQYDNTGQPIQQYYENSQPISQYDESGQPIPQYDSNVQPIQQYYENDQSVHQYDENGQPIQQYAQNDQPIPQYDENGQVIQQYDENGQPIYFNQEDGLIQYDENGQIIQQYDANGQPITPAIYDDSYQHYDANDQPLAEYHEQASNELDENGQTLPQYETNQYNETDQSLQQSNPHDSSEQPQTDIREGGIALEEATSPHEEKNNQPSRKKNVLDLLDTDSESTKHNTSKVSNDSDFDFSNS